MAGIKNTLKDKIHLNAFIGGLATDPKNGIANSFQTAQALDFRQKISQMSVLPGMSALSSTLSDLKTAMVQDPSGTRWAIGDKGYLDKISTSGVVSNEAKLSSAGAAAIVYNQISDQLYIPGQQTVSLYGQTQATPSFRSDWFGKSASTSQYVVGMYDSATQAYDLLRNNAISVGSVTSPSQVSNTLTNTYSQRHFVLHNKFMHIYCFALHSAICLSLYGHPRCVRGSGPGQQWRIDDHHADA